MNFELDDVVKWNGSYYRLVAKLDADTVELLDSFYGGVHQVPLCEIEDDDRPISLAHAMLRI